MGAKILLHFSKETLSNFPLIVQGYVTSLEARGAHSETIRDSNSLKSVEEKNHSLEETSSSAS